MGMGIKIEKDTRFLKIRYAIAFKRISRTEHEKCTYKSEIIDPGSGTPESYWLLEMEMVQVGQWTKVWNTWHWESIVLGCQSGCE